MINACSDGCCSDTVSTVCVGEDEHVIGPALFDIADLTEWLTDRFGTDWDDNYWIDVDYCEFY
jgi:hypothetical protein